MIYTTENILKTTEYLDNVDVVIFDLDDTLYSEKMYIRSGYKAVASLFPECEGMDEELWNAFLRKAPAIDEVLSKEGLMDRKDEALKAYRYQKPEIDFYPGIKEMLMFIKDKGLKIGMITDGRPEGQRAKIEALGAEVFFDKIIITDEYGGPEYRKPCDKAFVEMQQFFNVSFEKMIYVGDNAAKDFTAPEKLGMKSLHFMNRDGLY